MIKLVFIHLLVLFTAGLLFAGSGSAARVKERKTMKYDWLATARFVSWRHDSFYSLDEAREQAKKVKATGANTVITFGHHYRFDFVPVWSRLKESLKNIVTACHEEGLRVVEHHSATFVPPGSLEHVVDGIAMKDCTVIDARDGKPPFFESYGIIMLCCNNPNFRKVYFDYVLDLAKEAGVDALMSDDIEFCPTWYVCACEYCREKFRKTTGYPIPPGDSERWGNFKDPWFRWWLRFRMRSVGDYYVDLRKAMDERGLEIPLLGCLAGASTLVLSQQWGMTGEEFARGVDLNFYEVYHKSNNLYLWRSIGAEISYYQGIGRYFGQPLFTLHYTRSDDEMFFVWAFNLLMGDRLWLNSPINRPEEIYGWEDKHKELFLSPEKVANVALLFSRQTRDVYGGYSMTHYLNEWLGWSEMLLEENIPYDTILDLDLTEDLSRYKLLILGNAACLSESQVAGVRRFVEKGGTVIATHETACCDHTGARLEKSALADWIEKPPVNFIYYKDKVGATQVLPQPGFTEEKDEVAWLDPRDKKMRARLLAEVRRAAEPLPWQVVEGGEGVLANVQRVKSPEGEMLVAHLLNTKPLEPGDNVTARRKNEGLYTPKSFPAPVTLEFRPEKKPQSATLFSPDNPEPVALTITPSADAWRITVKPDQLRRYGAIQVDLEK